MQQDLFFLQVPLSWITHPSAPEVAECEPASTIALRIQRRKTKITETATHCSVDDHKLIQGDHGATGVVEPCQNVLQPEAALGLPELTLDDVSLVSILRYYRNYSLSTVFIPWCKPKPVDAQKDTMFLALLVVGLGPGNPVCINPLRPASTAFFIGIGSAKLGLSILWKPQIWCGAARSCRSRR